MFEASWELNEFISNEEISFILDLGRELFAWNHTEFLFKPKESFHLKLIQRHDLNRPLDDLLKRKLLHYECVWNPLGAAPEHLFLAQLSFQFHLIDLILVDPLAIFRRH